MAIRRGPTARRPRARIDDGATRIDDDTTRIDNDNDFYDEDIEAARSCPEHRTRQSSVSDRLVAFVCVSFRFWIKLYRDPLRTPLI